MKADNILAAVDDIPRPGVARSSQKQPGATKRAPREDQKGAKGNPKGNKINLKVVSSEIVKK